MIATQHVVWSNRRSLVWAIGTGLLCSGVLALIEGASVIAMLGTNGTDGTWMFTLARTIPPWLLFGACAPAFAWLARRYSFEPHVRRASIVVHSVVGVVVALAHLAAFSLTYVILREPHTLDRFARIYSVSFRYLFLVEVLTYWAIVGIYLTVHSSNLRTSLAEARLLALRAQLNPHFLFNSLHAISTLSLKGEHTEVAEMLGRLSDLLRAALDGRAQEVSLAQEMDFVDDYMALQRIRYADRLKVDKAISPEALTGMVPTMILQPLIENAIKHGVSAQRGAGSVDIRATRESNDLVLEIRDAGPGFPDTDRRDGIGLSNTRARLEQLYGSNHRLEFGRAPSGGASVRIVIPFRLRAA